MRGYGSTWEQEDVNLYKKDVRNLMRHMDMLKSPREPYAYKPQITSERVYEMTEEGGCWYADPAVKVGEVVQKGQKLGEIRDYFGNLTRTIYGQGRGRNPHFVAHPVCAGREKMVTWRFMASMRSTFNLFF